MIVKTKSQTNEPVLFYEKQRFTQWWMWVFILIPLGISGIGVFQQFVLKTPFGDKPMSDTGLLFFVLFSGLFTLFFGVMYLETTLTKSTLKVRFYPLTQRSIRWENVRSAKVISYGFVGGWGVRLWTQYGTVYNVKSGKGLHVKSHTKEQFLVGTQQPELLQKKLVLIQDQLAEPK